MRIKYAFLEKLNRPDFQPPEWVFNLVWPMLYVLMFVSFYVFLNTKTNQTRMPGIILFLIQLMLNFAWVPIFFAYRKIGLALVISIILTLIVLYMIACFWRILPLAGMMNIPYLMWLMFADILNYYLYKIN